MRNAESIQFVFIPSSEFRIPKRLAFLHQCVDWSLELLQPGKSMGCNRGTDYLPYLTGTPVIYH